MLKKAKFPLVSVIIVNFNGGGVFRECLKSLAKVTYPNWELILVDNGSSDKSDSFVGNSKLQIPNYKSIKNDNNLGFAKANNQGVRIARGKYILLLNNDTRVQPDFLTKMVSRMEKDSSIGVMQPKIYLMDQPGYLDNAGTFLTWTGFLQHWGFGKKDGSGFDKERYILSAKGACLLTRKEIVEKVGLFDEEFVSYFEESDFCWRVWLSGWKTLYFPDAFIYHKLGMTAKKMDPILINYHSIKNRIASIIKNASARNVFKLLIPHLFLTSALMFYYLLRLQFAKVKMVVGAIIWNIANLSNTLRKRRVVQKGRAVSDEFYFDSISAPFNFGEMLSHFRKVEANF